MKTKVFRNIWEHGCRWWTILSIIIAYVLLKQGYIGFQGSPVSPFSSPFRLLVMSSLPPSWESWFNRLMILAMDLATFCSILSTMGPQCHYLVYVLPLRNLPLHGSPLPSNLIEVLVVLTTLLKMVGNSASSLVDSLIGLDWIASKHAASSLLERLFLNNYILMYITGGICKSVTFCDGAWDTV